jgi:hypothetical protein
LFIVPKSKENQEIPKPKKQETKKKIEIEKKVEEKKPEIKKQKIPEEKEEEIELPPNMFVFLF